MSVVRRTLAGDQSVGIRTGVVGIGGDQTADERADRLCFGNAGMVERGHGYLGGGIKAEFMAYDVASVKQAWKDGGRQGEPRIVAGTWFASEQNADAARAWRDTYLIEGGPPEFVRGLIATGADGVQQAIEEYTAAGADELVFFGCVDDVAELAWLAETVAGHLSP